MHLLELFDLLLRQLLSVRPDVRDRCVEVFLRELLRFWHAVIVHPLSVVNVEYAFFRAFLRRLLRFAELGILGWTVLLFGCGAVLPRFGGLCRGRGRCLSRCLSSRGGVGLGFGIINHLLTRILLLLLLPRRLHLHLELR